MFHDFKYVLKTKNPEYWFCTWAKRLSRTWVMKYDLLSKPLVKGFNLVDVQSNGGKSSSNFSLPKMAYIDRLYEEWSVHRNESLKNCRVDIKFDVHISHFKFCHWKFRYMQVHNIKPFFFVLSSEPLVVFAQTWKYKFDMMTIENGTFILGLWSSMGLGTPNFVRSLLALLLNAGHAKFDLRFKVVVFGSFTTILTSLRPIKRNAKVAP